MWLTNMYVRHPSRMFGIGILITLVLSSISIGLGYAKIVKMHERNFFVWDNEAVFAYDRWKAIMTFAQQNNGLKM